MVVSIRPTTQGYCQLTVGALRDRSLIIGRGGGGGGATKWEGGGGQVKFYPYEKAAGGAERLMQC